jgi:Tfp pilus assembly protein PilN
MVIPTMKGESPSITIDDQTYSNGLKSRDWMQGGILIVTARVRGDSYSITPLRASMTTLENSALLRRCLVEAETWISEHVEVR